MTVEWTTPVFDRTQSDVDYAKAQLSSGVNDVEYKGCFNKTDINRIERNSRHLSELLKELYYANDVVYRVWTDTGVPTESHISRIINNIANLWTNYHKPANSVDLPTTLLTYEQVNTIERDLCLLKEMIDDMEQSFPICGDFTCGEREVIIETREISFTFYGYGPEFTFTCPEGTTWAEFYNNYPDQYISGMQWLHMGSDGYPYWVTFYIINSADTSKHIHGSDVIIEGASYSVDTSAPHPDTQ